MSSTPQKVALLKGGPSSERAVSLASANECGAALRSEGYDIVEIDAGPSLAEDLKAAQPDVVFNALHGRFGEDGCVQGILEWLHLPYTHSGVLASALAMDKARSKQVFAEAGLPTVDSVLRCREEIEATHVMAPPYVVKPNNEGSSVGVYIVDKDANGPPKLDPGLPDVLMVEAYVPGRELTTTVMGDRALGVTEIFSQGWYDYDAKYAPGGSTHVVPADVPAHIAAACEDIAIRAHVALGCRGLSRADFRWDDAKGREGLILLEVNTQPGMTPTSLAPEQAAAQGISFGALCRWLVEDASCNR